MKHRALTAQEMFRRAYNGARNFMAPNRLRLGKINPDTAYEIAWGQGMDGAGVVGVTVVRTLRELAAGAVRVVPDHQASRPFTSGHIEDAIRAAEAYVEDLKAKAREAA